MVLQTLAEYLDENTPSGYQATSTYGLKRFVGNYYNGSCTYTNGTITSVVNTSDSYCPTKYQYVRTTVSSGTTTNYTSSFYTSCPTDTSSYTYSCTSYEGTYSINTPVNNYICLGDENASGTCDDDNLYRIIGVASNDETGTELDDGMIKVIKNTSVGSYKWDGGNSTTTGLITSSTTGSYQDNTWSWDDSCLNTWNSTNCTGSGTTAYSLNASSNSFLSSINFSDKISETAWHCYMSSTTPTAATELASSNLCSNNNKVGLMYASDYLLSYDGGTTSSSSTYASWMETDSTEWTMSLIGFAPTYEPDGPQVGYSFSAWGTYSSGTIYKSGFFTYMMKMGESASTYQVRPVFHLNSTVEYKSGTGTLSEPFRIN